MSKELKAPDKVTQKMTRDGAVAENLTTGETSSISERPQEENYSAPAGVAAEKVVQHIGAEIERHAAKGAEKKALDATQPKTHSSRLQLTFHLPPHVLRLIAPAPAPCFGTGKEYYRRSF